MTRSHYMRHHLKAEDQLLIVMLTLKEQDRLLQNITSLSYNRCDAECEKIYLEIVDVFLISFLKPLWHHHCVVLLCTHLYACIILWYSCTHLDGSIILWSSLNTHIYACIILWSSLYTHLYACILWSSYVPIFMSVSFCGLHMHPPLW